MSSPFPWVVSTERITRSAHDEVVVVAVPLLATVHDTLIALPLCPPVGEVMLMTARSLGSIAAVTLMLPLAISSVRVDWLTALPESLTRNSVKLPLIPNG